MSSASNFRAALLMMAAMSAFTLNDAITKSLTASIGIGQTMMLRGILATAILMVLAIRQGALTHWRDTLGPMPLLRSLMEIGGTVTFFFALPRLPLANISAIYQSMPLAVTVGAALFLAEPVGWRRWSAITVGFAGVMLIVRPGIEGFNGFSLLVLVSVLFSATRDLLTRKMPAHIPTFAIAALASAGVTVFGAGLMSTEGGFVAMDTGQTLAIVVAAFLLLGAYSALISAMRTGEVSFIAPFRYISLVVALIVGYFAFSERPDAAMLIGSAVVVASGVYTFYRERKVAAIAAAAESVARPNMPPSDPDTTGRQ